MGELLPDIKIVPAGEVDPITGIDPSNILSANQEAELRRKLYDLAMNQKIQIPDQRGDPNHSDPRLST